METHQVMVEFVIEKQLGEGETLVVAGNVPALGNWTPSSALPMLEDTFPHTWSASVNVGAGATINYKYVCASDQLNEVQWMPGPNRVLQVPNGIVALCMLDIWSFDQAPLIHTALLPQVQIVAVYFVLVHQCSFGRLFKLVGNIDKLGKWDPRMGQKMVWHYGDVWIAAINLCAGTFLEYKIVLTRESDDALVQWQAGLNKQVLIPKVDHEFIIKEVWHGRII